jgi:transposase
MLEDILFSVTDDVIVETYSLEAGTLHFDLTCISPTAVCPHCGAVSSRVHSSYTRKPKDVAMTGVMVCLHLTVRRFICDEETCTARTFTEQVPSLLARYARKTHRLVETLRMIAFFAGGEAGAQLANLLAMPTSPDTLLRLMRSTSESDRNTPRVLGVDDWAFRKGQSYGTILVDLEKHQVIDLLPDRRADTLSVWLQTHPGVEIISRDRSNEYRKGATMGAPDATQVADRWHLLKNLREALERFFEGRKPELQGASAPELVENPDAAPENPTETPRTRAEQDKLARRQKRQQRYDAVKALHEQGVSNRGIARQLGMGVQTVAKYLAAETCPFYPEGRTGPGKLDPYKETLRRRWLEGCENASQLYREIQQQGYDGSRGLVARWCRVLRPSTVGQAPRSSSSPPSITRPITPKHASWLMVKPAEELSEAEQQHLQRLLDASEQISIAYQLAIRFSSTLRERRSLDLESWLNDVTASGIDSLLRFAGGLRQDLAAVTAAFTSQWSNGQVEGQVNRLKLIKRQMYGRANFDLLRLRVLFQPP